MNTHSTMTALLDFIDQLDKARIYYELRSHIPRAVSVHVAVPGERWEIEFHEDGEIDVEIFRTQGVEGPELLKELFERWSE